MGVQHALSEELRPGLHRLVLPLDSHSIGHVNVYALESKEGLLLIDCGWSTPEARAGLELLVAGLGYGMDQIKTLLLTHAHVDHCGLGGWIQNYGAMVGMHSSDAAQLGDRYISQGPYRRATATWLAWAGVPEEFWSGAQRQLTDQRSRFWPAVPDFSPTAGSVIEHGRFRLEVIHTPGHTPGSLSFYETSTKSLFTGDTLFARSTYSPTLRPYASTDPMSDYLDSILHLSQLDVELVLPGHHQPFTGLTTRVKAVATHHLARARQIVGLGLDSTAWGVSMRLSRTRPWETLSLGLQLSSTGEVCAHLTRLTRVNLMEERTGPTSIWGPANS
jgi:glyoxylase-like metal-dependent hydrolase (beta-lactamase superfamily II)